MASSSEIMELIEQSRSLERSGQIAQSIQAAHDAENAAQQIQNSQLLSQALLCQAQCHFRLGNYPHTQRLCQQAIDVLSQEQDERTFASIRGDALRLLGITALELGNMDDGEQYLHQVVTITRESGCDSLLARTLHNLSAGIYMPRGQFDLSLKTDAEALSIFRKLEMTDCFWAPLLTMTWVNLLAGNLDHLQEQITELKKNIHPGSLGEAWLYIIRVELALLNNEFNQAEPLLDQLFSLAEQLGSPEARFYARLERARQCRLAENYPTSLAWIHEAITIVENIHYIHFLGVALIERARSCWALGNLDAAEMDLRAAINHLAPQKLEFDISTALLLLSALSHQKNSPESGTIWQETITHLVQGGFVYLVERERTLSFSLIMAGLNHPDKTLANASAGLLDHLQKIPPAPLKICTLGGWKVQIGKKIIDTQVLRQRRAGELLGLLLISPAHTLAFDQIIDALWHDKEPASAHALFHHATSTLRRALEPDLPEKFPSRYLNVDDGQVSLHLPPSSVVDYEVFATHYRLGEWREALAWYGGEFLPEYRYADWTIFQRQWLMQDYQRVLLEMANIWLNEQRCLEALDACRKILAVEPWEEQAVLLGMQACLGMGDQTGALRLYKTLEKSLLEELGVEPQAQLQILFRSLLKR